MTEASRRDAVFVLHVWNEARTDGPGSRRGYVEHVASGERRYFALLDEALAFVDALTRPQGDGSSASDSAW